MHLLTFSIRALFCISSIFISLDAYRSPCDREERRKAYVSLAVF